jgi:hypothetical protein
MKTTIRALGWELIWKNRVVFPALALLLAFGAISSIAIAHAAPESWWINYLRGSVFVAFLTSIILGYALFTLMENNPGWRMNSMTTRWFVLPVRTRLLVAAPMTFALGFMVLLVAAWSPWLKKIAGELDLAYALLVFLAGITALQALAWTVPRRPGQYWFLASLIFLVLLYVAIIPQDMPRWTVRRMAWIKWISASVPLLAWFAFYAARQNRRGDWPGEISLACIRRFMFWRRIRRRDFVSPVTALFWVDAKPLLRAFMCSWLLLALILVGWVYLAVRMSHGRIPFDFKIVSFATLDILPFLGVLWLAGYGLFAGCEPNAGFHTRLSPLRATHPITAGHLAGIRIVALVLGWSLIWMPLLALTPFYSNELKGIPDSSSSDMLLLLRFSLAWKMALSAHVLVGALPLMLWGRLEGFPVLLLAGLSSWACTWILAMFLGGEEHQPGLWMGLGTVLALKCVGTVLALAYSQKTGAITWRFVTGLLAGWLLVTGGLIWALPSWQNGGAWRAASIALLVPLGRLACCPLAIAANRHR